MPKRIQMTRNKPWRKDNPDAVVVARGSAWGNPFKIGAPSGCDFKDGGDPTPIVAAMSREQVIQFYEDMIRGFLSPEMHPHGHEWMDDFRKRMRGGHPIEMVRCYLRGKDLACWCPLDQPCHADVLLRLANA